MAGRNGELQNPDADEPTEIPAARILARLYKAARIHEARTFAGIDEEESEEAEAGAILKAEADIDAHRLFVLVHAYMKANSGSG